MLIEDKCGYVFEDDPESFEQFRRRWLRRQGWKWRFWNRINMFCERICVRHIATCHRTKNWDSSPWWFRLASRIEFWSRPRR